MSPEPVRFMSLGDTAELLNISVAQARELVESGELPAIRLGSARLWRVERDQLEAYIEAKYEEARRMSLWRQSDFSAIAELADGRREDR
ncbi:MAG: helix-turn-helix domain-containing protein [Microbacterium sp.]|nr:helix-turn-helix domain-containing protein [Microbacterium sp.]